MQYYISTKNTPYTLGHAAFVPFYGSASLADLFTNVIWENSNSITLDENDNEYSLGLELPGYKQANLDITLDKNVLTVKAKKNENSSYERSLTLPRGIDAQKIEAKLEDGVLLVKLPKLPESLPRKISIK